MKKKCLSLLLVGAMVLSLFAACGKKETPAAETTTDEETETETTEESTPAEATGVIGKAVSIASADPVSLTPLRATGNGKDVLNSIYEYLIDKDGFGGEAYGVIAKEWHWDGDDFIVEIYDYVHDQAGNHITADDVVFSYVTPQELGYANNKLYTYCSGVEALDEYTVVFHFLPERTDYFNGWLDMMTAQGIFSQAAWEASTDEMAQHPVGTGRYTCTEFVDGAYCVLQRYDDYWQTDETKIGRQYQANVDQITLKFITDPQQIVNALKTGEIDYNYAIAKEALPEFEASPDWSVAQCYDYKLFCAMPNCLEGLPFNDINLRAAFFYALNVDDIIAALGGEDFAKKVYTYGVSQAQSYNPAVETEDNYYTKTDLDLAKEYLEKSNYNGETIKIWYETGSYKEQLEAVALIAGVAFESLGIKYEILTKDSDIDSIWKQTNSDWDLVFFNMGGNGHVLDYTRGIFDTLEKEGCAGNENDPKLDELFQSTYCESGKSQENVDTFLQYITDQYYIYGLFQRITYDVYLADMISDTSVKTFRNWIIPGSFEYLR
ncbi:MAG: ABC transporter substrate-binding protein [Lachnospiraceae bacterium]|jgi:ABC-type transport system substrate-binding protein|nr:ABC transporter substrate-binding protein [Lachnospiraceae bacterium]